MKTRLVGIVLSNVLFFSASCCASEFGNIWLKKVGAKKKVVFWSARATSYVWMRASRTMKDMLKDDVSKPVRIVCAKNERETRQFVITPAMILKDKIESVGLDVTELKSKSGDVIGKEDIQIEWVRHAWTKQTRGHKYKKFMPDVLVPVKVGRPDVENCYGKLKEPSNISFWVTFSVGKGKKAGIYRGQAIATIKVKGGKEIVRKRDIELRVLDITLPHMTHTRTALFTGNFSEWVVRDLASFRISYGKLPDEPKELVRIGRLMNSLGVQVTYVGPWGWPVYDAIEAKRYYGHTPKQPKDKALKECERFWRVHYPILKREGWLGQAYTRMPDEFKKMEVAKRVVKYVERLHKWAPGLRVLVTASNGLKDEVGEVLKDYIDIWCPIDYQRKFYQDRVKAGDELWPYIHGYAWFASDPIKPLRFYFWRLKVYNASGVCLWCIGPRGKFMPVSYGFVHEDDVVPGDGTLYYPVSDKEGVIGRVGSAAITDKLFHSTRLSVIRDGIEDREYMWLIDKLRERMKDKIQAHPKIVADLNEYDRTVKRVAKNMWKVNPEDVDRERIKFAQLIKELRKLGN